MRHNISIEGSAFRLRPVTEADAATIVQLRFKPELTRFVHAISPRVQDQITWLEQYFLRDADFYFIVETRSGSHFEGTVAVYDIVNRMGEWGRWILRPGSLAAPESVLLLYRVAFEILGLNEVYCHTVAMNEPVLSFHDRCGLGRSGLIPKAFDLGNGPVDAIEHRLSAQQWLDTRDRLAPQVEHSAQLVLRRHSQNPLAS